MRILFSNLIMLFIASISMAETGNYYKRSSGAESYYEKDPEGFYHYKDPKEEEKDKNEAVVEDKPAPAAKQDPWTMDADTFKKTLEDLRKKAVTAPTESNVLDYMIMQDIARKKARAYTNVFTLLNQKYPELNASSDYPDAVPGRAAIYDTQQTEIKDIIGKSSDDFALIFIIKEECKLCEAQGRILDYFVSRYPDWTIRTVDILERNEVAERLKVVSAPSVALVHRESGNHLIVGSGVVTLAELNQNIYNGIRYLKGDIKPEQWGVYNYEVGGPLDPRQPDKTWQEDLQ